MLDSLFVGYKRFGSPTDLFPVASPAEEGGRNRQEIRQEPRGNVSYSHKSTGIRKLMRTGRGEGRQMKTKISMKVIMLMKTMIIII